GLSCWHRRRAPQRPPLERRATHRRTVRWCWTGATTWGRVAPPWWFQGEGRWTGGCGWLGGREAGAAGSRPRQLITLSAFTTLRRFSRGTHYDTHTSLHSVEHRDPRSRAGHPGGLGATAPVCSSPVVRPPGAGEGTDGPCPRVRSQTGLHD